jgi:hypothetical protein
MSWTSASGQPSDTPPLSYQSYKRGRRLVTSVFREPYKTHFAHVRLQEILLTCGYKKEADELSARTQALVGASLKQRFHIDLESGLTDMEPGRLLMRGLGQCGWVFAWA